MDWSKITVKVYNTSGKASTGLFCLPSDGKLQKFTVQGSRISGITGTNAKVSR